MTFSIGDRVRGGRGYIMGTVTSIETRYMILDDRLYVAAERFGEYERIDPRSIFFEGDRVYNINTSPRRYHTVTDIDAHAMTPDSHQRVPWEFAGEWRAAAFQKARKSKGGDS